MKTCTQCKGVKPRTAFRRYWGQSSDGLRPLCKDCQRAYEKTWRSQHKEQLRTMREKRREKDKDYRWTFRDTNVANYLVSRIKPRALKRHLPFDLDQHLPELQERMNQRTCEMTGIPLVLAKGGRGPQYNSPSLDRIDPKKGYIYTNIQIVCFAINAAFGSWGEEPTRLVMGKWLER